MRIVKFGMKEIRRCVQKRCEVNMSAAKQKNYRPLTYFSSSCDSRGMLFCICLQLKPPKTKKHFSCLAENVEIASKYLKNTKTIVFLLLSASTMKNHSIVWCVFCRRRRRCLFRTLQDYRYCSKPCSLFLRKLFRWSKRKPSKKIFLFMKQPSRERKI